MANNDEKKPDPQAAVNHQITDSITQVNVKTLGDAPAMAAGQLYQTMAHSTGVMFENQVNAQHELNLAAQAATVTGVSELFTLDTAEQAVAATKINMSDLAAFLGSLMAVLDAVSGGSKDPDPKDLVLNVNVPPPA